MSYATCPPPLYYYNISLDLLHRTSECQRTSAGPWLAATTGTKLGAAAFSPPYGGGPSPDTATRHPLRQIFLRTSSLLVGRAVALTFNGVHNGLLETIKSRNMLGMRRHLFSQSWTQHPCPSTATTTAASFHPSYHLLSYHHGGNRLRTCGIPATLTCVFHKLGPVAQAGCGLLLQWL